MAAKIGVFLALDNEQEFSQGLKNAQASARLLQDGLKYVRQPESEPRAGLILSHPALT